MGSSDDHAFLYTNGEMLDLGTLGGAYSQASSALGINDLGRVVGWSASPDWAEHAFLYENGRMTDLNDLIDPESGWVLTAADDINNLGQIVGEGVRNGQNRAFLLTPVPEPSVITFYNLSAWDDGDGAANAADDEAIAPKVALRPGSQATFTNYTSYDKGINGLMIDVYDLPSTPTVNDFLFRVGNNDKPYGNDLDNADDDWPCAPDPIAMTWPWCGPVWRGSNHADLGRRCHPQLLVAGDFAGQRSNRADRERSVLCGQRRGGIRQFHDGRTGECDG